MDSTCYDVVTIQEIKDWCKIKITNDDLILNSLRISAIDLAERETGLTFINRNVVSFHAENEIHYDQFESYPYHNIYKSPINCFVEFSTFTSDQVWTSVPTSYYSFKNSNATGRILIFTIPPYDKTEAYPFRFEYTVGFGSDSSYVPESIKTAIKTHILYMYENRGSVISDGSLYMPHESMTIYNKYRVRYQF